MTRSATAGRRPTGRPDPPDSPGCAPASPRPASTPTSASGREHIRYLTGLALEDGEDKVAGASGQVPASAADEVVLLADSRYTIQARREAPDTRHRRGLRRTSRPAGPSSLASIGARRVAVEAGFVPHATWATPRRGRPGRRARARSRAGSRRTGRPRSPPSSSGSPRPARSPTARWPALLPEIRAGRDRARPRAAARVGDADRRRRGPRVRRGLPGRARRRRCRTGRPASGRCWTGRCCCSTSARRSPATGAT